MSFDRPTIKDLDVWVSEDATRISGRIFSSEEIYELERESIFKKCWQFVGCESQIREPGDFVRSRIGEQDVIVVRDKSRKVQVLANICRHRGTTLCRADRGRTDRFTCTYHGWSYALDGSLKGVPMERKLGWEIDKSKLGLLPAKVEIFLGLIFATFDPEAEPLEEFLGDSRFYLETLLDRRAGGLVVIGGPHKWELEGNWKSAAENMTGDFYHVNDSHASMMALHPGLADSINMMCDEKLASFVATPQGHALNTFIMPEGTPAEFMLPIEPRWLANPKVLEYFRGIQDEARERLGELRTRLRMNTCTIFPNLSILPGTFCLRLTLPKGPDRCESWCWVMGYDDMPEEVRQTVYNAYLDVFGPDGLLEPDDSENWANVVAGLSGPMASEIELFAGLGVGTERPLPDLPGIHAHPLSESGHRAFYKRWRAQIGRAVRS
ncbi:MAG: Rieske 2Fe-2S domain-containing protein [Deltaproteobacteria bacterium]|jgi:phenylpropionate dioxygenase-like ring-hydroxylating dioxygenase large terminal subunit|nr:Rieske 2Fe-2S domain-containing protein [Deltaproteobacteria bacterium]